MPIKNNFQRTLKLKTGFSQKSTQVNSKLFFKNEKWFETVKNTSSFEPKWTFDNKQEAYERGVAAKIGTIFGKFGYEEKRAKSQEISEKIGKGSYQPLRKNPKESPIKIMSKHAQIQESERNNTSII
jgi:hypothetical protein